MAVFFLLAYQPLSEHEGGFGFGLIIGGRRAADDNGGSTVTTQRVLQDTGHLAVSVGDVGLVYRHKYIHLMSYTHTSTDCSGL